MDRRAREQAEWDYWNKGRPFAPVTGMAPPTPEQVAAEAAESARRRAKVKAQIDQASSRSSGSWERIVRSYVLTKHMDISNRVNTLASLYEGHLDYPITRRGIPWPDATDELAAWFAGYAREKRLKPDKEVARGEPRGFWSTGRKIRGWRIVEPLKKYGHTPEFVAVGEDGSFHLCDIPNFKKGPVAPLWVLGSMAHMLGFKDEPLVDLWRHPQR